MGEVAELARKFNFSIDTAVLFTMLISGVWFGATVRADLNNTIDTIKRIEVGLGEDRKEILDRVDKLEVRQDQTEREILELQLREFSRQGATTNEPVTP